MGSTSDFLRSETTTSTYDGNGNEVMRVFDRVDFTPIQNRRIVTTFTYVDDLLIQQVCDRYDSPSMCSTFTRSPPTDTIMANWSSKPLGAMGGTM